MLGTYGDDLVLWGRSRALDNKSIARVHAYQNAVRGSQVHRRLGMRDAAWHHADFATTKPENFTRALEIGGAAGLDKQLRSRVKETTSLALKKADLFGDADLQLTSAQRREHSFEISRNRLQGRIFTTIRRQMQFVAVAAGREPEILEAENSYVYFV
jgi:hypothetical protein